MTVHKLHGGAIEQYSAFVGPVTGIELWRYWYLYPDGREFMCVARSIEIARQRCIKAETV